MSIFGGEEDDRYSDAAMIRAARKRLLEQIAKAEGSPSLVNNVYGGGGSPHMGGGVMDQLGSKGVSGADEDPFDYLVDITRKNTPDGWEKKVHRYREPKDHKKKKK
jgi:hypothetical protein